MNLHGCTSSIFFQMSVLADSVHSFVGYVHKISALNGNEFFERTTKIIQERRSAIWSLVIIQKGKEQEKERTRVHEESWNQA